MMFISSVYYAELSSTMESRRRMVLIGLLCGVQFSLLLVFKLYFFEHVSAGNANVKKTVVPPTNDK